MSLTIDEAALVMSAPAFGARGGCFSPLRSGAPLCSEGGGDVAILIAGTGTALWKPSSPPRRHESESLAPWRRTSLARPALTVAALKTHYIHATSRYPCDIEAQRNEAPPSWCGPAGTIPSL